MAPVKAFAHAAADIDVIADRNMPEFAFWDHGPELSRRFRALKISPAPPPPRTCWTTIRRVAARTSASV